MLETEKGSPDGTVTRTYEKGKEYNLPESLARVFIDQMEVAKEVTETVEDENIDDGLGDETPEPPKDEKKQTRASRKAAAK